MIRRARMHGQPTLWLPGLDHASIAAQYVLDRIIAAEGETRESLGRERYLERMWQFINETREVMLGQQRRIGASLDWSRLRFTMDEGSAAGRPRVVRPALPRGPGLPDRGARQLVPGLPDERQRPRGHPDARDGHDLDDPLPPARRGDGPAAPRRRRSRSPRPGPRRSSATRPSRSTPTIRATGRSSDGGSGSRSSSATSRSSPTTSVQRDFGTGALKITPAHDHDDYATGPPPRPADDHDPGRRRHGSTSSATATPGSTATRPGGGSWPT